MASRPTAPQQLIDSNWFTGPQFLIGEATLDNTPHNRLPEVVKQSTIMITKRETAYSLCSVTRSAIARGGYHIVGGSRLHKSIFFNCVTCRRLRSRAQEQKMSSLPNTRVLASSPFSHVGVDLFGPFHIKTQLQPDAIILLPRCGAAYLPVYQVV